MRIDRFLFFIRLVKSRTLAQDVIDTGHVRIDGRRVEKSSEEVRIGSTIALPLHGRVRVLGSCVFRGAAGQRRRPAPATGSWELTRQAAPPSERPRRSEFQ